MFSSLVKNLSYKHSFFHLAFEAQPACVSEKLFIVVCYDDRNFINRAIDIFCLYGGTSSSMRGFISSLCTAECNLNS